MFILVQKCKYSDTKKQSQALEAVKTPWSHSVAEVEQKPVSVVIAALTVQPSNYSTFINYTHMFCLPVVTETTSITGIDVFYSKGYLSKIMLLTEQINNNFPTTKNSRCC